MILFKIIKTQSLKNILLCIATSKQQRNTHMEELCSYGDNKISAISKHNEIRKMKN